MVNKKSPKASLEDKKAISLLLGLVVALSVLYVSLEWSSEREIRVAIDLPTQFEEPVIIPQTLTDPPKKPLPPKIAPKVVLTPVFVNPNPVDNTAGTETPQGIPSPEPGVEPFPVGSTNVGIEDPTDDVPFVYVENMPEFPGDILKYLAKHVRYPVIDQEQGIQGKVICQFVIDRDGSIIDFEIIRGVSPTIDKEAKRVVESMPKWKPGKQRNKEVKVKYTLPINFILEKM